MSKKEFLKQFEVKNPCSEDWDEMKGNEQARFCSHCVFHVNNLSAMTRKQAMKLISESNGGICVRYVQNPVDKTPVFADSFYQITRRAGIAAGFLGASLALSTAAQAQVFHPEPVKNNAGISQSEKTGEDKTSNPPASVSGTVTDQQGAIIPGIVVSLTANDNSFSATAVSNEEGLYKFENIPPGIFKLSAEGVYGFKSTIIENISVSQNGEVKRDVQMDVGEYAMMGVVAVSEYYSPLHRAVSDDNLELVTELIAKGEKINGKDENYSNITPLFLAVDNGNPEIAETLLNFGAKVNMRDDEKRTPLMRLDEDAKVELVRLLIKHGAKVNLADEEGNTALILAAENSTAEVLRELIDGGASVNRGNNDGETALMKAADANDLEKVRILLLAGAEVNVKNNSGGTAWDAAENEEVEKLLESYGAKTDESR